MNTPHTVTRRPYVEADDGLGNTVPGGFGPGVELRAYSIAPHTVEHGSDTITETSVADVDVFMPKTTVDLKDQFEIDTETFEVVGVQDWSKAFFEVEARIVVELRRVS
jgi:hypothetical protein